MESPIFDALVAVATDHHGYVTTVQARDLGIDPTQLRLLARRGRLEHAARGVYRVPVLPRTDHDDLAFAIAWSRGRAVISHESALVLHNMSDVRPECIHLTTPRDNFPRAQGGGLIRIHRREIPAGDVTIAAGLPVTTVERTLRDCEESDGSEPPIAALVSPLTERLERHREGIRDVVRRNRGRSVAVFGSVARGDDHPGSDIDFLVDFEPGSSLFDLMHIADELEALLGCAVDVVAVGGLKPRDEHILREAVPV